MWISNIQKAIDYSVEFEVYPSEDVSNKDYTCEIWIAVKDK